MKIVAGATHVHHREGIVLDVLGDAERRDPRRFAAGDYHPGEDFVDEFQLDQTDVEDFSRRVSPSGDRIFRNRPGVERPSSSNLQARTADRRRKCRYLLQLPLVNLISANASGRREIRITSGVAAILINEWFDVFTSRPPRFIRDSSLIRPAAFVVLSIIFVL
jgi:hypothetical protein